MVILGAGDGFDPLIFDPAALGLTVITFLGLLVVLRLIGWKPMLDAIESREKRIEDAISGAEGQRAKAETMLAEYEQRVANVEGEVAGLRDKGRAIEDIRRESVEIGMAIADRVVARKIDDADARRLADQVIAELEGVKN